MMKAWQTTQYGQEAEFELTEIPIPSLESGEILIQVKAISLNPVDNKMLRNELGINPELPASMHGDVSGVVTKVGTGVSTFKEGDEVYACAGGFVGTPGATAEYMPADARLVAHKPESLNFREAAALPLVAITAWESLIDHADIQEDDHVLVHAGTGGVGHVAAQLAKAKGARVATTISSEKKAQISKKLGADETINYREETVEEYVERLTDGAGFDTVYDTVGGDNFEKSLQAVKMYGDVSTVFTGTKSTKMEMMTAFMKAASVHAQNMSIPLVTGENRKHHGYILEEIAALADEGKIKPLLDEKEFSLSDLNDAHAWFEAKNHVGKIVLSV